MSISDFIHQPLIKKKKYPVGFEERPESKEKYFITEEHTLLSCNIEENLHCFGTSSDNDSISVQVGLFHPYHPDLDCLDRTLGFPETPIAFECPVECVNNLPSEIKQLLTSQHATKIYIRPFFQNLPWQSNVTLLIRPHHAI